MLEFKTTEKLADAWQTISMRSGEQISASNVVSCRAFCENKSKLSRNAQAALDCIIAEGSESDAFFFAAQLWCCSQSIAPSAVDEWKVFEALSSDLLTLADSDPQSFELCESCIDNLAVKTLPESIPEAVEIPNAKILKEVRFEHMLLHAFVTRLQGTEDEFLRKVYGATQTIVSYNPSACKEIVEALFDKINWHRSPVMFIPKISEGDQKFLGELAEHIATLLEQKDKDYWLTSGFDD